MEISLADLDSITITYEDNSPIFSYPDLVRVIKLEPRVQLRVEARLSKSAWTTMKLPVHGRSCRALTASGVHEFISMIHLNIPNRMQVLKYFDDVLGQDSLVMDELIRSNDEMREELINLKMMISQFGNGFKIVQGNF